MIEEFKSYRFLNTFYRYGTAHPVKYMHYNKLINACECIYIYTTKYTTKWKTFPHQFKIKSTHFINNMFINI